MESWQALGSEHGSAESKGEREDGVLPLDHLERNAEVAEEGHEESLAGLRA